MKKSTLITTIAMIVVVVVALSTATYAWFSSSTTTKVETQISTQASSGWLLYGGSLSGTTLVYSSTTSLDWTLPQGIYSPTNAALSTAVGGKTANTTFTNVGFFQATVTGGEYRSDAGSVTDKVVPKFVRVINNNAGGETLELTIYVVVPNGSADNIFRAASGFRTYISAFAAADNAARPLTTGYKFGTLSATTTGTDSGYYTATHDSETQVVPKSDGVTLVETVDPASAIASSGYYQILEADTNIINITGAAKDDYVRTIKIDVAENMAKNTAVNLAFYAWLDGWDLDDSAAGVEGLKIVYSFGTKAQG